MDETERAQRIEQVKARLEAAAEDARPRLSQAELDRRLEDLFAKERRKPDDAAAATLTPGSPTRMRMTAPARASTRPLTRAAQHDESRKL
jgi:hypothetical protein